MSLPAPEEFEPESPEARLGETLEDRYRIDAVLGVGAMGSVYRARHLTLRKDVAVKLLHRQMTVNPEIVARFDREAAAASRLDHPNCVRVMDFGRTETGHSFLVMELLEGHDVASMIDNASVPVHRTVEIVAQVLAGLEHAHKQGLIHRDIKPENIFINRSPEGAMVAKVVDFGIAKVEHGEGSTTLTKAGMVFGTPQYMSPEQALGRKVDVRTDLYSLGMVMHAMLAGELPFDGDDPVAILKQQVKAEPPSLPEEIPEKLRAFVTRMVAKEPDERFRDAKAALATLKESMTFTTPNRSATVARMPDNPVTTDGSNLAEGSMSSKPSPLDVVKDKAQELWTAIPQQWRLPAAVGAGILVLVGMIAAFSGGDGDTSATETPAGDEVANEGGDKAPPPSAPAAGGSADDAEVDVEIGEGETPAGIPASAPKGMAAALIGVDELVAKKKWDSARITLDPLVKAYPDEPAIHIRMGRVMTRVKGKKNVNQLIALESYRTALSLDSSLAGDDAFTEEFYPLLDKPAFRARSVEIAVDLLGDTESGLERIANWLNVQKDPLPYPQRHKAMKHLRAHGHTDWINEALQTALDLWQAPLAEDPCVAFDKALDEADAKPDSFLAGTIDTVPIPKGPDEEECPGAAVKLAKVQVKYLAAYTGFKATVPDAYRRRKRR